MDFSARYRILVLIICFIGVMRCDRSTALAGNIDPEGDDLRYAYGENIGWANFDPSFGPGVTVDDSGITGYVWHENVGWINLQATGGGILNDGIGNLSGWAWGENIGWISFSCKNTSSCDQVSYGVTIDRSTGLFTGYAWGENIGWLNFGSEGVTSYGVKTAWLNVVLPGDMNDDSVVDLRDAILALQVLVGMDVSSLVSTADVNTDGKISTEEAVFVFRSVSGLIHEP